MPITLRNATMPIQLRQEVAPTIDGLISQIDPWVLYHLQSIISSNVHYENQLYGPINTFISSIFPTRRRYMTIPQALLRRAIRESDEVDEFLGDISIGSTGGLHESRDRKGSEVDKRIPDFLIVKVEPTPANLPRAYTPVCMVEVKRDEDTYLQAEEQMLEYMQRVFEHGSSSDDFRGYLVMGQKVVVYGRDPNDAELVQILREISMLDDDDPFTRELSRISVNNWNE